MRRRLTLLVAATTSVVLIAFLVPIAVLTSDLAANSAIRRALAQSQSLAAYAGSGDLATLEASVKQVQADGLVVSVFRADGTVVGDDHPRDLRVDTAARTAQTSLRPTSDGGRLILQPVFGSEGVQVVRVEVPPDLLDRGVARARGVLVALALVLFVGCVAVADRIARGLTRPLEAVTEAAERLGRGDLGTRVDPTGTRETREIARAMNRLAGRIGELLDAEREQVADLSHRLRTPVTVLRLDAEGLSDPAERERIGADVEELTRQVDEVIREARRVEREGGLARCDVVAVVRDRAELWEPLAADQGRSTDLRLPHGALDARISADDLAAAVDALFANVMAHTPDGAPLRLTVARANDGTVDVVVEDGGPGLPTGTVPRRGESGGGSTGLGLDIARRTATVSGGTFRVDHSPDLGGARVSMRLGAAAE